MSLTTNQITGYIHGWLERQNQHQDVFPSLGEGGIVNELIFSVIFKQYFHHFQLKNVSILFCLHYHKKW